MDPTFCNGIDINVKKQNSAEPTKVVVIGSGYAGVSAIQELESRDEDIEIE